jgi:hypothetical protein
LLLILLLVLLLLLLLALLLGRGVLCVARGAITFATRARIESHAEAGAVLLVVACQAAVTTMMMLPLSWQQPLLLPPLRLPLLLATVLAVLLPLLLLSLP